MRGLEAAELNLFDLFAKISLDTSEYDSGVKDVEKSGSGLASKLKSGLATAGKVAAAGVGLVTGAATAAAGALLALEASTEEYRIAQGKLNTAFEAAGYSADTAKGVYEDFYGILGDTDTATEASQLLAKLADSQENLSVWTRLSAGVYGTFGDSLPIEGLIEAANETAKVGTVTGTLADALNWAGISEDEFNAKLAACSDESERNQIIMDTLSETYDGAADAFYRNNEALVASRDAQAKTTDALAQLGNAVSEVKTKIIGEFAPAVSLGVSALAGLLSGSEGSSEKLSEAIRQMADTAAEKLPEFLEFGTSVISSILSGIIAGIPSLVSAVPSVVSSIVGAFVGLLPEVLAVGGQLLEQFVSGIETGLPDMIARLPQVIDGFLDFITENLPAVLEKGVELLTGLVYGILAAIPVLLSALPDVISAITEFFVENFPKIVTAGGELIGQLIVGIIGAIPEIAVHIPSVITALVEALEAGWEQLKQAGVYLLEGLWNGISDKISWLKGKVLGVVDTIKSWFTGSDGFDTHSPSKWSAGVMKNVMDGLSVGSDAGLPGALRSVRSAVESVKGGLDFGTASVDFASSGLGVSSAGIINGVSSGTQSFGGSYSFNLILPTGEKLASYVFSPMVDYAKANGTPILNPT